MSKGYILNLGTEPEFFEGESRDIVLDVIRQYIAEHPNELRRMDILNGILAANKTRGEGADGRRKRVKEMLKGCNEMNSSLEGKLKDLGCTVMGGKKHYKIRLYEDTRYQATMSKTSSDGRAGSNLAAEIAKIMF